MSSLIRKVFLECRRRSFIDLAEQQHCRGINCINRRYCKQTENKIRAGNLEKKKESKQDRNHAFDQEKKRTRSGKKKSVKKTRTRLR